MTDFTSRQLAEIILLSLREAARDVDERRVPLDGRVRVLLDTTTAVDKAAIHAAE